MVQCRVVPAAQLVDVAKPASGLDGEVDGPHQYVGAVLDEDACTWKPPSVVANVNATASSFAVSHAEPEDAFVAAVVVVVVVASWLRRGCVVVAVVFVVVFVGSGKSEPQSRDRT